MKWMIRPKMWKLRKKKLRQHDECKYNPDVYFLECVWCDIEHVFNIILGKKTGTTFPVSIQDKEINALLDTGAEKSCISIDMFNCQ